jgi:hypothetical protein
LLLHLLLSLVQLLLHHLGASAPRWLECCLGYLQHQHWLLLLLRLLRCRLLQALPQLQQTLHAFLLHQALQGLQVPHQLQSWPPSRPLLLALCLRALLLLLLAHQQLAPQLVLLVQLQRPPQLLHLPAALLLPLLLALLLAQVQVLLVHLLLFPLLLVSPRASAHQLLQHRPQGAERHPNLSL